MDELHNYIGIPRKISNVPRNFAGNVHDNWHYSNNLRVLPDQLPLFFLWSKYVNVFIRGISSEFENLF